VFLLGRTEEPAVVVPFNATHGELQSILEELYGKGNVQVSGGPGDAAGDKPYVITFTGGLADQRVPLTAFSSFFGLKLEGGREEARVVEAAMGRPDGYLVVTATNLGDASISGGSVPVAIGDRVPGGLRAVSAEGFAVGVGGVEFTTGSVECSLEAYEKDHSSPVACAFAGMLPPYTEIELLVGVVAEPGAPSGETNMVSVSGGGASSASMVRPVSVGGESVFGVQNYEMVAEEDGGGPDRQAGSHPFQLTTTIAFNQTVEGRPVALVKDLNFRLPPGLIGNPTVLPRCPLAKFLTAQEGHLFGDCPPETVAGIVTLTVYEPIKTGESLNNIFGSRPLTFTVPVFNLEPQPGEPARFGFETDEAPVFLDTSVRTGQDYGVTVSVRNITQTAGFLKSELTFWGVPGDPRHERAKCFADVNAPVCGVQESQPPPFLSLPTSCSGGPLQTTVDADSWMEPSNVMPFGTSEPMVTLDGCNRLPFEPLVRVTPDGQAGSTPTGLTIDAHVAQAEALNGKGLAPADVQSIKVALPEGVAINPAGGDGLQACSESQIGFTGFHEYSAGIQTPTFTERLPVPLEQGVNFCPDASKIATVTVRTPILPDALEGSVYLATPAPNGEGGMNPFNALVALYMVAEDPVSGVLLKLPGRTILDPSTGQVTGIFQDTPQAPFEDAELHFFGGSRAPLATPAHCGSYATGAVFGPWSGSEPVGSSSVFQILTGPNLGGCPGPFLPFKPELTGGTTSIQAGGFSPFTNTMSREDGQQAIQAIQLRMPPGVSGLLSGVELCREAQANTGTCGPNSLIGETIVSVGLGGDPFSVKGGRVYITEKYAGAPFGLSIVNPAKAGPFDLGEVIVRAKINIDPVTAALTVTTDNTGPYKIPPMIDGIPLQIKHVNVTINRPAFTFNPTNCNPMQITGSIASVEGSSSPVTVPFQVTNCAVLAFKPGFKVSTAGRTSRANGASLHVKLTYPKASFGSQANIKSVKVDLPKQLPSRLTTLQKACTAAQFEANPAGCPAASIVGHATAITPLIPVALTGPAYFVSYGGAKFPELVIALQGYGVTLNLHGETFINKAGITSSTFRTVPDAPVGSFELTLPQGKYSALAANGNLCTSKLKMPTAFTAQNGAVIKQSTPISVTGCAKKAHKAGGKGHKGTTRKKKK
jgi:hypothetical protein